MESAHRTIIRAIAEFLSLAVLTLSVPALLAIDILVLEYKSVSDNSMTELAQHILLFAAMLCFGVAVWRMPEARGFLVLGAGFLACMFIREVDSYFDRIRHGFWVWPAMLTALASIAYALHRRGTVLRPMAAFTKSHAFPYLAFGMLVVLLFSRVFGSGNLLWAPIMGEDYSRMLKESFQEGLELFGYIFICWGAWSTLRRPWLPSR